MDYYKNNFANPKQKISEVLKLTFLTFAKNLRNTFALFLAINITTSAYIYFINNPNLGLLTIHFLIHLINYGALPFALMFIFFQSHKNASLTDLRILFKEIKNKFLSIFFFVLTINFSLIFAFKFPNLYWIWILLIITTTKLYFTPQFIYEQNLGLLSAMARSYKLVSNQNFYLILVINLLFLVIFRYLNPIFVKFGSYLNLMIAVFALISSLIIFFNNALYLELRPKGKYN